MNSSRSLPFFVTAILGLLLLSGTALAQPTPKRASAIPESATLALFGSGVIGLAALVRRHFSE